MKKPQYAWIATAIWLSFPTSPLADISTDGTLGVQVDLTGPDFTIDETLGQTRGTNLFHSFSKFNILTGESATFTGSAGITDIFSRVTGGQLSTIDGLLKSDIDGANFYLINPAGVMFGENASLDISGSFHVTTASHVRFADNGRFDAANPPATVLTSAPASAFGFLSDSPAAVTMDGASLQVAEDNNLQVVAGDITLQGASLLAPSGQVELTSVASAGDVTSAGGLESFQDLGKIRLTDDSYVDAGGNGGGTVRIRGGQVIVDGSQVYASTKGEAAASPSGEAGDGIDIQARGKVALQNATTVGTNIFVGVADDSGGVRIKADELVVDNASVIQAIPDSYSTGNGGDIEIQARHLAVNAGSFIRTNNGGSGRSGDIDIQSDSLEVTNGSFIYNLVYSDGDTGDINIDTGSLLLADRQALDRFSAITTQTREDATGAAGDINIRAGSLVMESNAVISSPSFGAGAGGDISIEVDGTADLSGSAEFPDFVGIFATSFGSGNAGSLTFSARTLNARDYFTFQTSAFGSGQGGAMHISADTLRLENQAALRTVATSTGSAGTITVDAGRIILADAANLDATTSGDGRAGDITIHSESLDILDHGYITVKSSGGGDAGIIDITTERMNVENGGQVTAVVFEDATGRGGEVRIKAASLTMRGVNESDAPFGTDFTGVSVSNLSTSATAIGGDAVIDADSLVLDNRASIAAISSGPGPGGDIRIQSNNMSVRGGSNLNASALGTGDGGSIVINTDTLEVSGGYPDLVEDAIGFYLPSISAIVSQAGTGGGAAGDITINTGTLKIADGGLIAADTFGSGAGGTIHLKADNIDIGGSYPAMAAVLEAQSLDPDLANSRIVTVSHGDAPDVAAATGDAGDIVIDSPLIHLHDKGTLSATTGGPGSGGDISITTSRLNMESGAVLQAGSVDLSGEGTGNAGSLTIVASDSLSITDSRIETSADNADGGNIDIRVNQLLHLTDSEISTTVGSGDGSGGNIFIDPVFVVLDNSRITANAFGGPGGNITIVADNFFADPDSVVEASSALGIDGTVTITSPDEDISSSLGALPENFLNAEAFLRQRCEESNPASIGSFVVSMAPAVPVGPGGAGRSTYTRFTGTAAGGGQDASDGTVSSYANILASLTAPCTP